MTTSRRDVRASDAGYNADRPKTGSTLLSSDSYRTCFLVVSGWLNKELDSNCGRVCGGFPSPDTAILHPIPWFACHFDAGLPMALPSPVQARINLSDPFGLDHSKNGISRHARIDVRGRRSEVGGYEQRFASSVCGGIAAALHVGDPRTRRQAGLHRNAPARAAW
ncbi:hypothetical protein CMUS01_08388 [Colletotrichum musicola]|uniref:Uncharacterized protein n=1 Tax=Colletotrichum musicola TaxID=2175873 RepID=A0A8H6KCQ8_9PEZI|nr:hypothetical protein CMUS01_08388 [Colletotrichum musicola]